MTIALTIGVSVFFVVALAARIWEEIAWHRLQKAELDLRRKITEACKHAQSSQGNDHENSCQNA